MLVNFASPFTMHWYAYPSNGLNLFPSISRKSGFTLSLLTALCIPVMDALRMFMLSISSALTSSTAHAMASASIIGRRISRDFSLIFFESFRSG